METQNHVHNVRWQVSLSNGETLYEDKGDYLEVFGEPSPWQKLLKHIQENNLTITSLSLYTDDGRTFNLPSLGKNPKFSAFNTPVKPVRYVLERQVARDIVGGNDSDLFTTVCAFYEMTMFNGETHEIGGKVIIKLSLWVDEHNTKNTWSLVSFIQGEK